MRIEKLGVKITDVPFIADIEISEYAMTIGERAVSRSEMEQMRDALTAALAEYDALTATDRPAEQPAPDETRLALQHKDAIFRLGQALNGDEDLPVGAVVRDGMSDKWHCLKPGRYSMNSAHLNPNWTLSEIIDNYSSATIVSLP